MLPLGSSGNVGYNPRDKNDPRRNDPCIKSTSCSKTETDANGRTSQTRECYTEYACNYYATHEDAYETTTGDAVPVVNEYDDAAAGHAAAAAAGEQRRADAEKARAEQAAEDQRQSLIGQAWDNVREWAGGESASKLSTALSWISLGAGALSFIPGIGLAAGVVSVVAGVAGAGIDCLGGGLDGSCAVGLLGAAVGSMGLVARGVSRYIQATPADEISAADITSFGLSAPLGLAGLGASAIDNRVGISGW
jgi:hypothetical protein